VGGARAYSMILYSMGSIRILPDPPRQNAVIRIEYSGSFRPAGGGGGKMREEGGKGGKRGGRIDWSGFRRPKSLIQARSEIIEIGVLGVKLGKRRMVLERSRVFNSPRHGRRLAWAADQGPWIEACGVYHTGREGTKQERGRPAARAYKGLAGQAQHDHSRVEYGYWCESRDKRSAVPVSVRGLFPPVRLCPRTAA